jgi:hypothetical protein
MKSHSSDENTGYNQTTTMTNTYLNDYHQQQQQNHRFDAKHNLKLEHFKFSPSNKSMTPHNSAITNTLNQSSGLSNGNSKNKNVLVTIQNQNLLVQATLNASIQAISTNNVSNNSSSNASRHKILRNKVFNNNNYTDTNHNESSSTTTDAGNIHSSNSTIPSSTITSQQQQQAMQQKLTYLKRYVANGLANKNSLQFSDGYWNRIPGSKLKTTTIRTNTNNNNTTSSNSNNQINVLASFTHNGNATKLVAASSNLQKTKPANNNGANFLSLQNVNGQLLPNRELSIIDLQLPVRKQTSQGGGGMSVNSTNGGIAQHQLISLNKIKTKANGQPLHQQLNNDYYANNSQHSHVSDTSELLQIVPANAAAAAATTQSKIMLTAVIKPQLNMASTNQDKNNILDSQFTEISQFFSSNETSANVSGGYEHLLAAAANNEKPANKLNNNNNNDINMSNYKNKNYFKYVMNQQKKRQNNHQMPSNNGLFNTHGISSNMHNSMSNEGLNSPNVSSIMPTSSGYNKRQVQLLNHEVPMHSNLNNISSNALLIRRLKF